MVSEKQEGRQERRGLSPSRARAPLQRQTTLDKHHVEFLADMVTSQVVVSSCIGCEVHKDACHGDRHHSCSR